jgi:hypothetical protein
VEVLPGTSAEVLLEDKTITESEEK